MNGDFYTLVASIKSNSLVTKQAATGFFQLKCPVCRDSKPRAGFKFDSSKIIYNCFRGKCSATVVYDAEQGMTKKFRSLMQAMNIEVPIGLSLNKRSKKSIQEQVINKELFEKPNHDFHSIPPDFIRYDKTIHQRVRDYLVSRGLYDEDYYIGTKGKWMDFLIVPFYLYGRLIGWQGIKFISEKTVYQTFGRDLLYTPDGKIHKNCVVVEGVFDAKSLPNCIAVLSSDVSKKQAYLLRDKNPILLPDRKGSRFLTQALEYDWRISIPKWKEKDLNEAVLKHGKFIAAKEIHDGIAKNQLEAELKFKMWCQKQFR